MAGVEGFEPSNAGTKNRCLTTWRHPNKPLWEHIGILYIMQVYFFATYDFKGFV